MSDANKKHYFTTISKEEAVSFLSRAPQDERTVSLWQKGQNQDDVEEYRISGFDEKNMAIILESTGGFLSKLAGTDLLYKEVFFKINFETINIFSYSTLKKNGSGKYELRVLNDVYKSQKRSNYRLLAGRHVALQFKIADIVYNALDISAGGTSIMVETDKKDLFSKNSVHKDCRLRINRAQFDIPFVKIVGQWEQFHRDGNPTGEMKLGIAFIDLPERTEEELFKEINSEARAEEIRKKMNL